MRAAEVELGVVVDVGAGDRLAGQRIVGAADAAGQRDEVGGQGPRARVTATFGLAGAALVHEHRLGHGPARG